jgi:hypothetical protein
MTPPKDALLGRLKAAMGALAPADLTVQELKAMAAVVESALDRIGQQTGSFDEIVSAWDEQLHCEARTMSGTQCRRLARWRVNFHGCEHRLLCGHHLNTWIEEVQNILRAGQSPACARCDRTFDSPRNAYSATRL